MTADKHIKTHFCKKIDSLKWLNASLKLPLLYCLKKWGAQRLALGAQFFNALPSLAQVGCGQSGPCGL